MPEMGESVTEGTVLEWHVAEGDAVEEGETVIEVSTDKVDAEVPAPCERHDHEASGPAGRRRGGGPAAGGDERGGRPGRGEAVRPWPACLGPCRPRTRSGGGGRRWFRPCLTCGPPDGRRAGHRHRHDPGNRIRRQGREGRRRGCRRRQGRRRSGGRGSGRGEAPARACGDAREGDEREPRDPDGDLVQDRARGRPRRQAQGAERCPEGPRDEDLVHASGRLGHREGRARSSR